MPKAQSTSSHKTAAKKSLGITRGWHKGFVGYLEKYQTEWDSLDAEEMQQFLRDRRDGLIAWRKDNKILKDLPETSELKNHLASYYTSRQPLGVKGTQKPRDIQPKTVKKSYPFGDVVRNMFKDRVLKKTHEVASREGIQPFQASKKALKEVTAALNAAERKQAEKLHAQWNSGKIRSEADRRLYSEAKLASESMDFIDHVKQMHCAHVVMMVAFPSPDGQVQMTMFESTPPANSGVKKKFSQTAAWKKEKFAGAGFEEYAMSLWPQDDSGVAVKEEDWRDLIYEAERTDPTTGKRYRPIPMLAPFKTEWYTQRVRDAWRGYVTMMLSEAIWRIGRDEAVCPPDNCLAIQPGRYICSAETIALIQPNAALSGKDNALVPWKSIKENPDDYVQCVPGVRIDWSEPSRVGFAALTANWESCVAAQSIVRADGESELQIPFEFKPKILVNVRKGKNKIEAPPDSDQEMFDIDAEGEEDPEDEEEQSEVAETETESAVKPAPSKAKRKGKAPAPTDDSDVDMAEFTPLDVDEDSSSEGELDELDSSTKDPELAPAKASGLASTRTLRSAGPIASTSAGATSSVSAAPKALRSAGPVPSGSAGPTASSSAGVTAPRLAGPSTSASAGKMASASAGATASTSAGKKPSEKVGAAAATASPAKSSAPLGNISDSAGVPEREADEGESEKVEVEVTEPSVLDRYTLVEEDTWEGDLWVADEEYWGSVNPEPGSPARAILDKLPVSFMLQLCEWDRTTTFQLVDLTGLSHGATLHNIPGCLIWTSPKSSLPDEFLNKSLDDFKDILNAICDPVLEQGLLHHSSLLAIGLLYHHVLRAELPQDNPDHLICGLSQEHIAAFKMKFGDVNKCVQHGPASEPLDAFDFPPHTKDKAGLCWPKELPLRAGDEGSPSMAARDRKRARKFVIGLSDLPTYVDACKNPNMKWTKIEKMGWTDGVPIFLSWFRQSYHSGGFSSDDLRTKIWPALFPAPQKSGSRLQHPQLLAVGLILREISAALKTRKGEIIHPALPGGGVGYIGDPSDLTEDDLDFVNTQLEALLRLDGHAKYTAEAKPKRSLRAKKESKV